DEAIKAATDARFLFPEDQTAKDLLKQAEKGRDDAKLAADRARMKQEEDQRAERVRQLLGAGRNALNARQWEAAGKALSEASKLAPQDPQVKKALADLDQARSMAVAEAEKLRRQQEVAR